MMRIPPHAQTPACPLERAYRADPENAALPRALRAIAQAISVAVLLIASVAAMIGFVYGLLLVAWGLS